MRHDAHRIDAGPAIALIGAPTDVGAGVRGASMGPEALRIAGLAQALRRDGHEVGEIADVRGPDNPLDIVREGYRHLDEVVAWNGAVHDAVSRALAGATMPVLIGGDHSLAVGSIGAVARHCRAAGRQLRVIWLDAHADCNVSTSSPSGNLHGMGVACLLGMGPAELTRFPGETRALAPDAIRLLGVRSIDPGERTLVEALGLTIIEMHELAALGPHAAMAMLLADVDENTHVHVSFDVDFLDPVLAPGVGTAVAGGPGLRIARTCMAMLAATGRVGSVDVMELNPALDVRNRTATVVVDLLRGLFARHAQRDLASAYATPATRPAMARAA